MPNIHSEPVSKADTILSGVFGPPVPGFCDGALPTERDIMALYLWFVNQEKGDSPSPGAKVLKKAKDIIYNAIADMVMVHWRHEDPNATLKTREAVKQQVFVFITKRASPLSGNTRLLKDDENKSSAEKILEERQRFESIFDIKKDPPAQVRPFMLYKGWKCKKK